MGSLVTYYVTNGSVHGERETEGAGGFRLFLGALIAVAAEAKALG